MSNKQITALFAGTFDPYTIGHHRIVQRALAMSDRIVIAIGRNIGKQTMLGIEERIAAIEKLSPNPEITRFKGLGEISPDEFRNFIGPDMRLERVELHKDDKVEDLLSYYMGKNTMERQNFIIDNLVVEEDKANEDE